MLPYLTEHFGNASSLHGTGRRARAGLDEAHEAVARSLGATPREIVITSGGTEANNLAIKARPGPERRAGHRIITSSVEHHAIGTPFDISRSLASKSSSWRSIDTAGSIGRD